MKYIYIQLSRHHNFIEDLTCFFRRGHYSHASIALSEYPEVYYSFNLKGFHIEKADDTAVHYSLLITDEQYGMIASKIQGMCCDQNKWHYSLLGVFLAFLHIPHNFKNRFYCSQFVMKLLKSSGVICSKKTSSTTLPNDLFRILLKNNFVQV